MKDGERGREGEREREREEGSKVSPILCTCTIEKGNSVHHRREGRGRNLMCVLLLHSQIGDYDNFFDPRGDNS